jgi:hypothetical protein
VILQILGIYLVYFSWYTKFLELQRLYNFILECYKPDPAFQTVQINYHVIVVYTAILWVISFVSGYLINLVIRRAHLDKRFKIFSFDNEWYYYLSGEILDFPHVEGTSKEVGLTFVDVLTKTGEETVLYSGICQKFDLKEDGGLASICLTNVQRKGFANIKTSLIQNDPEKQDYEYKEIPSTFLVIPFDNILNLNVRFFKVNIKTYTPPQPTVVYEVDATPKLAIEEKKKEHAKIEMNLSALEAIILALTFLMLIVFLISIFSKPDKDKEEEKEDEISFIYSIISLIVFLFCKFALHISWLYSILLGISSGVLAILLTILYVKLRDNFKNRKKKQAKS